MRAGSTLHIPPRLSQHVHHLHLENWVDGFDTNASTALWHRKHIHHAYCKVVDEFSKHKTHNLHGDARATVPEHLEEGEGRNVNRLGVIDEAGVVLRKK